MKLNTIKPTVGSKRKAIRVGRGAATGKGKTCGRGVKGQKSRSGGFHKIGFEGGQMPMQRRLPKFGFKSRIGMTTVEIRLHELERVDSAVIDVDALKKARVIRNDVLRVRVIASGKLEKAVTVKGLHVTKGARKAIEDQGGKVE